jgi:ATP-dependent helicase/nuclease subunit A
MTTPHKPQPAELAETPKTIRWTDEQLRAITERRGDVVVSASAGSGKTAVLTERVLRILTETDPVTGAPPGLDQLLVITFTEKATRQMRERIEAALRARLEKDDENPQLRDALDKLPEAWIMTIDAFCRRVVLENFHQVGLSPGARIPDASELAEMEMSVLREVLDQEAAASATAKERLETLLRGQQGQTATLIDLLRALMAFLQSLDQPERWQEEQRSRLRITQAAQHYDELPEALRAREDFARETHELAATLEQVCRQASVLAPQAAALQDWGKLAQQLHELADRPGPFAPAAAQALVQMADGTLDKLELKRVCGAGLYTNTGFCKRVLAGFSKLYASWRKAWAMHDETHWLRGAQLAAKRLLTLLELAQVAIERLKKTRQRRGMVTFNDFERLTLELLGTDPTAGPTALAYELRKRFAFVLVDEYQDTSPLQDAIVSRVARSNEGDLVTRGNLFIVGDVKQSIYRFRHAEPKLFRKRIETAQADEARGDNRAFRIDLLENFRSRAPLLDFVNACFARLMDTVVGDLEYDERERLKPGRPEAGMPDPVCVEVQWLPRAASAHETVPPASDHEEATGTEEESGGEGDGAEPAEDMLEMLRGIEAQTAWVAARIRALTDPVTGLQIPDEGAPATAEIHPLRMARPGDCAILLRGLRNELEAWLLALAHAGLRVRAPGINPLFTAPELVDLLNAMRVADNPFQDLPLASLLRSPLFEFSDEALLRVRMVQRRGPFHEALWRAAGRAPDGQPAEQQLPIELQRQVETAVERIHHWRWLARTRPGEVVLETIVAETAYDAWLTGQADAGPRLEHLDYLRGLVRRLGRQEAGGNSLATFLELIARAETENKDLDLPESIAGDADAVNLLTIHKSKGLEFPVVFVPRLERRMRDPGAQDVLFDLQEGVGARGINIDQRRVYATLMHNRLAGLRRRKERSEEFRLLYVAMTRARERLVLLGQLPNLEAARAGWQAMLPLDAKPMPVLVRLRATRPADLLGPIVEGLQQAGETPWLSVNYAQTLPRMPGQAAECGAVLAALARVADEPAALRETAARELENEAAQLGINVQSVAPATAPRLLPTADPFAALTTVTAKTTVTDVTRSAHMPPGMEADEQGTQWREEQAFTADDAARRPLFSPATSLQTIAPGFALVGRSAAALEPRLRGTLHHRLLATLDLQGPLDVGGLREQAAVLIGRGVLTGAPTEQILAALDYEALAWVFTTGVGKAMLERQQSLSRELPFTMKRPATDFMDMPNELRLTPLDGEFVLVQGMIDVVLDAGDLALLADYKTDHIYQPQQLAELTERYRRQLDLYGDALQGIWNLKQVSKVLLFLDARHMEVLE